MSNSFLARDGAPCSFPLLCVGIFWHELSQALSPRHSLCELLCASTLSESYNLSAFSSTYIPKPQGEGFDKDTPFRAECSKALHSLLITVYCKRKLPWWGLSEGLVYGCSAMSLGVVWLLRSCSRTAVADFPQGSWSISSQALGLKKLKINLQQDSPNITVGHIPSELCILLQRHFTQPCSLLSIQNSQKLERHLDVHQLRISTENGVHLHNGISFSW